MGWHRLPDGQTDALRAIGYKRYAAAKCGVALMRSTVTMVAASNFRQASPKAALAAEMSNRLLT